jgi:hypothetical protein
MNDTEKNLVDRLDIRFKVEFIPETPAHQDAIIPENSGLFSSSQAVKEHIHQCFDEKTWKLSKQTLGDKYVTYTFTTPCDPERWQPGCLEKCSRTGHVVNVKVTPVFGTTPIDLEYHLRR